MTHNPKTRKISLGKGVYALVDASDYVAVATLNWHSRMKGGITYAVRGIYGGGRYLGLMRMHRFILMAKHNQIVDHINGNGLDNRRKNLRICTASDNQRNRKTHREGRLFGTFKIKDSRQNPWGAQIYTPQKFYLGSFPTEKSAHEAVLVALSKKQ